jgi:hypothetical protein
MAPVALQLAHQPFVHKYTIPSIAGGKREQALIFSFCFLLLFSDAYCILFYPVSTLSGLPAQGHALGTFATLHGLIRELYI